MQDTPTRESLPDDGGRYPCSYAFVLYEDWRCDKNATHALTADAFMRYTDVMSKHEVFHGRAMCETHLSHCEAKIR